MRQVYLKRTKSDDYGTFGELRLDDPSSDIICVTVELTWRDNHPQTSCIPTGVYIWNAYNSPKHGDVWMAENVPGRSSIEIHAANFPSDLLGCIGPGEEYSDDIGGKPGVTNSKVAFKCLKSLLPPTFEMTISNAEILN